MNLLIHPGTFAGGGGGGGGGGLLWSEYEEDAYSVGPFILVRSILFLSVPSSAKGSLHAPSFNFTLPEETITALTVSWQALCLPDAGFNVNQLLCILRVKSSQG